MALENRWSELSEERKAKMRACKTPEELLSVAREVCLLLICDCHSYISTTGLAVPARGTLGKSVFAYECFSTPLK